MSTRKRLSFNVKLNTTGDTITIHISDPSNLQADNLALATWGSSEVLANTLHRLPTPDFAGTGAIAGLGSVLELGAGTGLVGLSAAAIWRVWVTLTDLEPILPNIKANIELNRAVIRGYGGSAACGMLDWARPDLLTFFVPEHESQLTADASGEWKPWKFRVVLAADTVYSEEHPELLTKAVTARLERSPKARFIMCYPLRIGYLDHIRDLWERLELAGLGCMQEGRESLHEEWDEDTPYEWCVWRWRGDI
ncbi:hypothetical protein BAUCODRAFT_32563 [Baudoinia panamericana UAMH 10762]|uniref:Uncharacterized protein n=1 Tax=Baudoinia panamericana (strain UAMH 10762) TaxID=717646 RepID=M2MP86_BAUPA|nr:uncharacterized protein BAUCODRAFT_32563 [Baudoinia panamericana UAMH 10762]EMC98511.1 hypothetical protein BAUCODRAFT_32563 [Baudoinia panamericana UAMH 10762]